MVATRVCIAICMLAALGAGACTEPCVELSRAVCRCERDDTSQQACMQRVDDAASQTKISAADNQCCEVLLDECTCDRLAQGDLAACGLAQESDQSPTQTCVVPESLQAGDAG